MSEIKQFLRLYHQGKSIKFIARNCSVSKNTVKKYIYLATGLKKPIEELLSYEDEHLAEVLNTIQSKENDSKYQDLASRINQYLSELSGTGVTRQLLWEEYRLRHPSGYSYSQFCHHLKEYQKRDQVSPPQHHDPGDLLYMDFAGKTMEYTDRETGEVKKVQVYVGVLGYSQYSYVEAIESQKTQDYLRALANNLQYIGGTPKGIVPDNFKGAVTKTDRYEPDINRQLQDFANHYGTAIIPARSRKPKDKSLAENLVKHTYSHIYAPLRNRQFYSLAELNTAIRELLDKYNRKLYQGRDYSRNDLFEKEEKKLLKALPDQAFEVKKYRHLTVQKNSHILLKEDSHYYSIPYQYIGKKVTLVYTASMVHVYCQNKQIACHTRNRRPYGYTTRKEHLPSHQQKWLDRSPQYYKSWAARVSKEAIEVVEKIFQSKAHPEQAYKSCEGLQRLLRSSGEELFTKACKRALELDYCNYSFLRRIIENKMVLIDEEAAPDVKLPQHENIRGKKQYQQELNLLH